MPVGVHTATLSASSTGWPPAFTRSAALTHWADTQGPLPPGGTNGQPATTHGDGWVVMGWLPTLPREATTYPGSYSYRDIFPPRGPAELKDRVEELERGLWDVATGRPRDSIEHTRYRRLYAYFEAGAWISVQQSRRLRGRS